MGNFCCAPEEEDDEYMEQEIRKDKQILDQAGIGHAQQIQRIEVKKSGVGDFNKISLNHFELIKVIGKGSFGKVILVKKKTSNRFYAMKILKKINIDSRNKFKHTQNERKILENSNYHFAVSLRYAFQNETKLFFIMDFINGGELFRRLRKNGPFDEPTSKFYIAEIICAIEYLHKKNIIYRDLKPENVLLDCEGHLKLTDFGLAKQLDFENDSAFTICGTPEYLAPEIIKRQGYGKEVDYWTIGILLYELLTLRTPFRAKEKKEIFDNVLNKEVPMKDYFSEEAKSFIKGLLTIDPTKRLGCQTGMKDIKMHPFFSDINWELLSQRKATPPWKPEVQDMSDLKYFDERLLALDPYQKDSDESCFGSDDDMQFDGFTLDPSKLRTFALTPNKRSQISQIHQGSKKSQLQRMYEDQALLMDQNPEQTKSQQNSPKSSKVIPTSKSAFHKGVETSNVN